jgi:hypothetical protein
MRVSTKGAIHIPEKMRRVGYSYSYKLVISHKGKKVYTYKLLICPQLVGSDVSFSPDVRGRLWVGGLLATIGIDDKLKYMSPESREVLFEQSQACFGVDLTSLVKEARKLELPVKQPGGLWQRLKKLL